MPSNSRAGRPNWKKRRYRFKGLYPDRETEETSEKLVGKMKERTGTTKQAQQALHDLIKKGNKNETMSAMKMKRTGG